MQIFVEQWDNMGESTSSNRCTDEYMGKHNVSEQSHVRTKPLSSQYLFIVIVVICAASLATTQS